MRARWIATLILLAVPGQLMAKAGTAKLNEPVGRIDTDAPVFVWSEVAGASEYFLWVNNAFGVAFAQWVSADEANCATAGVRFRHHSNWRKDATGGGSSHAFP